jgi:hypothetical protein
MVTSMANMAPHYDGEEAGMKTSLAHGFAV